MRTLLFGGAMAALVLALYGLSLQPDRIALLRFETARLTSGADIAPLRAAAVAAADRRQDNCLADFSRGALAVALDRWQSEPGSDKALSTVRDATTARLRCAPADANAWLILARTAPASAPPEQVLSYVRESRKLAPAEGWIIESRLAFVCRASSALQSALSDISNADAAQLLAGRRYSDFAKLYNRCGEPARRSFDQALAGATQEVRAAYARLMARSSE